MTPKLNATVSAMASLKLSQPTPTPLEPQSQLQAKPFRFFDLPTELRLAILELALVLPGPAIDLDPSNYRRIAPLLRIFLASHRLHDEAHRVFYGENRFRLFSIHGRFINTKRPLLSRLSQRAREAVTSVEFRLGPGWHKPPRAWTFAPQTKHQEKKTSDPLGLAHLTAARSLRIFIEFDPAAHEHFHGWQIESGRFTVFSRALLRQFLLAVPSVTDIEIDANASVPIDAPLLRALLQESNTGQKRLFWGATRGLTREEQRTALLLAMEGDVASDTASTASEAVTAPTALVVRAGGVPPSVASVPVFAAAA